MNRTAPQKKDSGHICFKNLKLAGNWNEKNDQKRLQAAT